MSSIFQIFCDSLFTLIFILKMGLDYSYSQPSESEDYGGNDSSDTEDREVEDLIRRDQAELTYNSAATV